MKSGLCISLLCLVVQAAQALGPHEILVLVNTNSAESVRVADVFVNKRHVPPLNVVNLALPEAFLDIKKGISPEAFTAHIWAPAIQAIADREIGDHILAWVYSTAFPTRIVTTPAVSIQGITFVRNVLPNPEKVRKGLYQSVLYTGPSLPKGPRRLSESFGVSARNLEATMPLPSMMLGYTGGRGNTEAEVLACIQRGVDSDGTAPDGKLWIVSTPAEVRSKSRSWQWPGAERELEALDVATVRTSVFPEGATGVLGVIMGASTVDPDSLSFRPGAMADHLTSFAGAFDVPSQTKLSAWIRAGTTSSAGTVTEPYAAWTKFPSAHFFVHYARGCSMIESYFQSIFCPMQILLVGEPLATPWKPAAELDLGDLGARTLSGSVTLDPEITTADRHQYYGAYTVLVDDRLHSSGRRAVFHTRQVTDGPHRLRVVAHMVGLVRHQVFAEIAVTVGNSERGMRNAE